MSTNTPIDPFYVQVDDELEEMQPQLKRALEFTDEEFARLSPEVRNLFAARRHLGHSWLDDYQVVVEITGNGGGCSHHKEWRRAERGLVDSGIPGR